MNERAEPRKPAAFRLDDPRVVVADPLARERDGRGGVEIIPEPDASLPAVVVDAPARRGWRWGTLFWSGLGGLVALGAGLSIYRLIADLFSYDPILGFTGIAFAALTLIGLAAVIAREAVGLARLSTIEQLHERASRILASDDRDESRALVSDLLGTLKGNPRLARARAIMEGHAEDIIDGADRVRLAERELMSPLDAEARRLVTQAAQRVSIVTAVSPRAAVDMLFVLITAVRLIRQLAYLYGGRPGALGMISLVRHAISHLAITGGVAASDSVIQQMLGQGLAAKLSERLGEGVLNGLLTARLGLAAIDVTRPLPFNALPRPALTDLARNLIGADRADQLDKLTQRRE